jgi:hypothetical protein
MRLDFSDEFARREARGGGVSENACHKRPQPPFVLVSRPRLGRARPDKGSDAASSLEDAVAFELGIHAGNGIRVDAQIDRQLANGRQLIADAETASRNGRS